MNDIGTRPFAEEDLLGIAKSSFGPNVSVKWLKSLRSERFIAWVIYGQGTDDDLDPNAVVYAIASGTSLSDAWKRCAVSILGSSDQSVNISDAARIIGVRRMSIHLYVVSGKLVLIRRPVTGQVTSRAYNRYVTPISVYRIFAANETRRRTK